MSQINVGRTLLSTGGVALCPDNLRPIKQTSTAYLECFSFHSIICLTVQSKKKQNKKTLDHIDFGFLTSLTYRWKVSLF